jgi:hypothetical protein
MPIPHLPEPGLVQRVCILLNILLALKVSEDLGKVTYTLTLPYGRLVGNKRIMALSHLSVNSESGLPQFLWRNLS